MMIKPLRAISVSVGVLLIAIVLMALPESSVADISKDAWLGQVKEEASVPICKSFIEDDVISVQMKAHHVSYSTCLTLIPAIAEKCGKKYDASLPTSIDSENSDKWGRTMGECIGNDFALSYLSQDSSPTP